MDQKMSQGAKLNGRIKIDHFDKEGQLIETVETPNTLTNTGFNEVAGLICSDESASHDAFNYIAVGTGTTAADATDTALESETTSDGLSRASATGTLVTVNVTDDTAQFVHSFNVTGSVAVTESGVFNDASAGTMLCRQVFSAINVADGDTLQITWKVTVA